MLGARQQQHVVHQARGAGDLGRYQLLHPAHLGRGGVRVGGEHLDLAGDHGQRGSQLVRRVGEEVALGGECRLEPVEHVVKALGQDPDLPARVRRRPHPRVQIAVVDPCRDPRHPPQRPRHPNAGEIGGDQRQHDRDRARDQKRLGDTPLSAGDHDQRLAGADPHAQTPDRHHALVHSHLSEVGRATRREPQGAPQQRGALGVLALLRSGGFAGLGACAPEQLRVVADRAVPRHHREQQRRGAGERLGADIAVDRARQLCGRVGVQRPDGLGELGDVAGHVGIDLRAQLPGALHIDHGEDDRAHQQQHAGDPGHQPPA